MSESKERKHFVVVDGRILIDGKMTLEEMRKAKGKKGK